MLKRIGAEESGEFKAVASGTLPSGKPVVVNADGTVSVVASTGGAPSAGTPVLFRDSDSSYVASVYDTTNNKVVIAYMRTSTGYAVVGTVSGTSISFGSEAAFESGNSDYFQMAFDANSGKVVIAYHDQSNSDYGTAVVGTVSGTSISFGTPVVFNSAYTIYTSVVYDSNAQKVVIAYRDVGNSSAGTAIVGTVSGTSISFGSETAFESGETNYISAAFDSTNNKVVIAYQDSGDSNKGKAIVGTVSGTSISFGSIAEFEAGNTQQISTAYDSNAQKVVIAYLDNGNSDYGTAIVGTVSGTSISFGTAVVFLEAEAARTGMTYDSGVQKIVLVYNDGGNSSAGTAVAGTVSGTSISFSAPVVFESGGTAFLHGGVVYDPDQEKVVTSYQDGSNGSKGTSAVITTSGPNITLENYIGISRGVAVQESISEALGSATVFHSSEMGESSASFDSTNNKVVIFYHNAFYLTSQLEAIVGTVSNGSISFGSAVVVHSGSIEYISSAYDSSNQKFVVAYRKGSDSKIYSKVGTVSGTSISFGSEAAVDTTGSGSHTSITFDSTNNKVAVVYSIGSYGYVKVGTISGTSISYGSRVSFDGEANYASSTFDADNGKVIIAYGDGGNSSYNTAVVGTISGTSISFGTPVVYESTSAISSINYIGSSKVFIGYKKGGSAGSRDGEGIVGTISGTSISFGSSVVFESNDVANVSSVYHSAADKVVVFYEDINNSQNGEYVVGTISGTSVSFTTGAEFENAAVNFISAVYDSNDGRAVAFYKDEGNSSYGTAITYRPSYLQTTRAEVASGQAASMDIIGSVSDNQIGLTPGQQYFVQTNGTIGTTAATPSVLAGTAISATELLVKT